MQGSCAVACVQVDSACNRHSRRDCRVGQVAASAAAAADAGGAASAGGGAGDSAGARLLAFQQAFWKFLRPHTIRGTILGSIAVTARALIECPTVCSVMHALTLIAEYPSPF